jgi:hypothetical protein
MDRRFDRRLETLQQEIALAIEALSPEQLRRHPLGKWCIVEVLEHLYLTYTGTLKGFERVAAAEKPLATSSTLKQRAQTFVVIGLGYLPSGREAPPVSRPRGTAAETVLAEIGPKIAEMDAAIARCEEKFGRTQLLDHPILGPLSAAQWRKFHLVHGRHHVKQIRALRGPAG